MLTKGHSALKYYAALKGLTVFEVLVHLDCNSYLAIHPYTLTPHQQYHLASVKHELEKRPWLLRASV